MARGLYGQKQGDENRNAVSCVAEHFADNNVAEGEIVNVLRNFLSRKDLQGAAEYMETLRVKGHSDHRISMMYGQASAGISF